MAPGRASSTRLPSSLTTNRPQSWIRVAAACTIARKLKKDPRKVRESAGRDDRDVMRVVSVNVGLPRTIHWQGREHRAAIERLVGLDAPPDDRRSYRAKKLRDRG